MDKTQEALARIIDETSRGLSDSRKIRQIMDRIEKGKATYADALEYARENSRVMTGSLRRHLPDVLTDGKLYRATAETVVRVPMEENAAQVIEVASEIQEALNAEAGISIQAIRPEINQDQVDGIITGICNAEDYAGGKERLFEQIENFLEGTVDDCARENADFHYQAGLSPKIERRADAKCCSWCSALAGVYDYADVMDGGNDVYRRHRNCHCLVLYNPGDGSARRQNAHSKEWTNNGRDDRIKASEEQPMVIRHTRVKASDLQNGLPINGEPNGITDKLDDTGKIIQRRKYGRDGRAAIDYDLTDHGERWKYPTGAHKHVFDYSGKKPKRKNVDLTPEDLTENADIIIKGANYFEEE